MRRAKAATQPSYLAERRTYRQCWAGVHLADSLRCTLLLIRPQTTQSDEPNRLVLSQNSPTTHEGECNHSPPAPAPRDLLKRRLIRSPAHLSEISSPSSRRTARKMPLATAGSHTNGSISPSGPNARGGRARSARATPEAPWAALASPGSSPGIEECSDGARPRGGVFGCGGPCWRLPSRAVATSAL